MDPWISRRSKWEGHASDARTPFGIDYSRVIHSSSFRRLQGKTQILNLGDSDFYRTRLTHSLEVAQIALGIVQKHRKFDNTHEAYAYLPSNELIQTVGFCHDLGHPPFGHGGEVALNYCMRDSGGFEGNGQTLRILSKLENFSENHGSDLTRRALLGVLKYPLPYSEVFNADLRPIISSETTSFQTIDRKKSKPPKCYHDSERDVVEWILEPLAPADNANFKSFESPLGKHRKSQHKSFDCSIMDTADDIAYGVHDLEDAISLGLIRRDHFCDVVSPEIIDDYAYYSTKSDRIFDRSATLNSLTSHLFGSGKDRKRAIGWLVGYFINRSYLLTNVNFDNKLLRFKSALNDNARVFLDILQKLVVSRVITSANVQHLEFKGQRMVVSVFEAIQTEPDNFLPSDYKIHYKNSGGDKRIICDYIAGMTDSFLLKTYDRLFSPRMGSVFDKL